MFYGTPARDGYLIRIRTPGGLLSAQQARGLAAIVQQWNCSTLQVTNRANLQLRAVRSLPTIRDLEGLQTLGLASHCPEVDRLRNIMASPTAGIDPQEAIDTRPIAASFDRYLQHSPELADLPSKFGVGVDGGGSVGLGDRSPLLWEHRYNEIQLSAFVAPELPAEGDRSVYFQLAFDTGQQLQNTQVVVASNQILSVLKALTVAYLEASQQAVPAGMRLKQLLQLEGIDAYLQRVERHLGQPLQRLASIPALPPTQPCAYLGLHQQQQAKRFYLGLSLPLGHLSLPQLVALAELSETFGSGQLRLAPWQAVLLPDIPEDCLDAVSTRLSELELPVSNHQTAAIFACGGKPGCKAAATQTQAHAIALANHLQQHWDFKIPVNIHLTGCPKSCAQPRPAEVTLLGTTIDSHGENQEGYRLYLGNARGEQRALLNRPLQVPELLPTIDAILRLYRDQRAGDRESFGEFVSRYPFEAIASQLRLNS